MSKKTLVIIGIIILAVVVIGVLMTTGERGGNDGNENTEETATSSDVGFVPSLINGVHQYAEESGNHAIRGQADVASACYELDTEVSVDQTTATLAFTSSVIDEDQMCAQVITAREFSVDFSAPEDVMIEATYNGQPVELNLQMVEGESDVQDAGVYPKG